MVKGDRSASKKDESKCESGHSEREFVSTIAHQAIVKMDFGDCDRQVDADGKSGGPGEQANQYEQAAKKFREGRQIGAPGREAEAGHELNMVVEAAEDFVISVVYYDGAKGEAHNEEREGLQAVKVAQ